MTGKLFEVLPGGGGGGGCDSYRYYCGALCDASGHRATIEESYSGDDVCSTEAIDCDC